MAYDQHATYEPPRRGYYGQLAPKTSQPNMYQQDSGPYSRQDGYEEQPQYHQQYAYDQPGPRQGYPDEQQTRGYADDRAYEQPYDRSRQDNDNRYNNYQQDPRQAQRPAPQQNYGREERPRQGGAYQEDMSDRSYDARYQPRAPPQAPHQGYAGQPRRPEGQQMPAPRNFAERPPNSNETRGPPPPNETRGRPYNEMRGPPTNDMRGPPSNDVRGSASNDTRGPPRQNGYPSQQPSGQYAGGPNSGQHPPPQGYDGRPQSRSRQPAPAMQRPPIEPRKDSMAEWKAREKAKMQMPTREAVVQDNAFPSFGNGRRKESSPSVDNRNRVNSVTSHGSHDPTDRERPLNDIRKDSYANERTDSKDLQHFAPRSELNSRSAQPSGNWPIPNSGLPNHQQNDDSRYQSNPAPQRPQTGQSEQWPIRAEPAPYAAREDRSEPAQPTSPGYGSYYNQVPAGNDRQPDMRSPVRHGPPALPQIDTAAPLARPAYPNQQPMSPASAGPRSAATARPGMAFPDPSRATPQYRSRDEEIEEAMPDFGNSPPSQSFDLPRRNPALDRQMHDGAASAPPASMVPPAAPSFASRYGSPAAPQQTRAYNPQYGQDGRAPREDSNYGNSTPTSAAPRVMSPPQQAPYNAQYQANPQNGYRDGYGHSSYDQDLPPPRAPFADGQPVRRNSEDSRQLPFRPNPQSRMGPNGQQQGYTFNGAPLNPSQRPEMARNFTEPAYHTENVQQQRSASAAPSQASGYAQGPGMNDAFNNGQRPGMNQTPMRGSHPDALPHHPAPIRAGLTQQPNGNQQAARPPPVRNHNSAPPSSTGSQRPASGGPANEPITQAELNRLLADVEANPHNPKRALIYAKRLVEASTVLASEGGRADVKTTAKNRDRYITDAYKRVKKLAAGGYPEAQFYLADCYGQGQLGLEPDTKEAFSLYQAAAKAGHPQAAYRTAVCCEMGPDEGGGTRKDFPKAVQWYRRAATLGDTAAMFKIGVVLLKGLLGEQKNVAEAINWLKRAAERADKDTPHALHELAGLYDTGNTAPEIRNKIVADDSYALELLERAAALGYKFSQFRLGQAYEYGHLGLDIDNRLSITWYTRAAAQGEHQAELALSGWYLTGAAGILEHNDTEAYLWARKAAVSEPPLAKAMFAMGYFAENGIGCPASMEDAKKWYGRAAYYKFPKALERIEELKRNPNKGRSNDAAKLSRKDQKRDEAECTVM